jgi:hypothetical protein
MDGPYYASVGMCGVWIIRDSTNAMAQLPLAPAASREMAVDLAAAMNAARTARTSQDDGCR